LLAQGQLAWAIGLLVYGLLVVFIADHFVRPVLISGAARLSFLWVLLGLLGGLETFGLLGLFLGPAILAALMALWRDLAAPEEIAPASVPAMEPPSPPLPRPVAADGAAPRSEPRRSAR
jgi:predicted PurR-regulated permease PerM